MSSNTTAFALSRGRGGDRDFATGYAEPSPDAAPDLPRLNKLFLQHDLARAIAIVTKPEGDTVAPFSARGG